MVRPGILVCVPTSLPLCKLQLACGGPSDACCPQPALDLPVLRKAATLPHRVWARVEKILDEFLQIGKMADGRTTRSYLVAEIVFVHGIAQEQAGGPKLESEWILAMAGGLENAGFRK